MVDFEKAWKRYYDSLEPEERVRVDAAIAERKADEALPRATVIAVRIDCNSGQEREVPVRLVVRSSAYRAGELWIHVEGGSTGFESMPVASLEKAIAGGGWTACLGTKNRWDRLFIPPASLAAARELAEKASAS